MKRAPKTQSIAFQSVGCKLNHYEIEALKHNSHHRGYKVVPFADGADIYVVNTCTVTGAGDADSRKALRRALRANPKATVVATGCYAQRKPEELKDAGAHLVLGNGQKAELLNHLEAHLDQGQAPPTVAPQQRPTTETFLHIDGMVQQGRTRGTLQIQDGCDEHCTYCIIPAVRGFGVSRPLDQVVHQAQQMAAAGYGELALTGVHSGSYGRDQGQTEGLVRLLEALEPIDGLQRIRLNSIEPGFVSDALIDFAAASHKFCPHFHVPLQSGDDHILKRMGRHYRRAYYAERIERIAQRIPDCAIGADIMVGFPGETQTHFDNTYALLRDLPMTYLHVFSYSMRQGTPAERLSDHQPKAIKSQRARTLIELGRDKRLAFHQRFVGRRLSLLAEKRRDRTTNLAVGMSANYIKVLFESEQNHPEDLVDVAVTSAREDLAFGKQI